MIILGGCRQAHLTQEDLAPDTPASASQAQGRRRTSDDSSRLKSKVVLRGLPLGSFSHTKFPRGLLTWSAEHPLQMREGKLWISGRWRQLKAENVHLREMYKRRVNILSSFWLPWSCDPGHQTLPNLSFKVVMSLLLTPWFSLNYLWFHRVAPLERHVLISQSLWGVYSLHS